MQPRPAVGQIRLASALSVLVGLWQASAPFVLGYSGLLRPTVNDVLIGGIVAVLAASRYLGAYETAWPSWVSALLGGWLLVAPFALDYTTLGPASLNDLIVGTILIVLGFWNAAATNTVQG